jgi:DNA-binding GntR family transcriptional regulator
VSGLGSTVVPVAGPGHSFARIRRRSARGTTAVLAAIGALAAATLPQTVPDQGRRARWWIFALADAFECILYLAAVTRILQEGDALVRNASVAAQELIREAILDGRLEPGRRLKEEELARELGISRTPVREALLMLHAEGLVVATPNRGAIVRVHEAEDLDDLYQLRALLEGHATRRAATRISEREIEVLRESCERFESLIPEEDLRELVRENLLFHNTILDVAGSARLAALVRKVIELPLVYKSYIWYSPDQKRISVHYHRQIVNALAMRDAERAELVMKEHVFEARDLLVSHVRARPLAVEGR